jgi:hypothetical protein
LPVEAHHAPQERGLSSTVPANERDKLAFANVERHLA